MSEFQTVAHVGDIPEGEGRAFCVNGKMVAVFLTNGEYSAISDLCPHMGASLAAGYVEDGGVTCPWHAWRFCIKSGTWLDNPNSKTRTETFDVRLSGREIQVHVPDPIRATPPLEGSSAMNQPLQLRVDGLVAAPRSFAFDDLRAFPESEQVRDFTRFHPKRSGDGVTLRSLLDRVRPASEANYLTLHATHDDFAASIPLAAILDEAVVVYQLDGAAYPESKGGPFRFLIKNPAVCHTDELDDCANVKFVDRIELTAGRGRDTRPHDEQEHEALHQK